MAITNLKMNANHHIAASRTDSALKLFRTIASRDVDEYAKRVALNAPRFALIVTRRGLFESATSLDAGEGEAIEAIMETSMKKSLLQLKIPTSILVIHHHHYYYYNNTRRQKQNLFCPILRYIATPPPVYVQ